MLALILERRSLVEVAVLLLRKLVPQLLIVCRKPGVALVGQSKKVVHLAQLLTQLRDTALQLAVFALERVPGLHCAGDG